LIEIYSFIKEMKVYTLISAFVLICLATSLTVHSQDTFEISEKTPSLMEIINEILNDAEFLSLTPQQQLRVLIHIYDMLEEHLKTQYDIEDTRKRSKEPQNVSNFFRKRN